MPWPVFLLLILAVAVIAAAAGLEILIRALPKDDNDESKP
jgi:hypothetical protein